MAQFLLQWDNADVIGSGNSLNQRASVRRKTPVGAWVTAGFSPANDLATSVISATTPVLLDNVIYQFKIENICTAGGPTLNDNGIREAIQFGCIAPVLVNTDSSSTATVDLTNLDITRIRFILRRLSDNAIISSTNVTKVGNSAVSSVTGLAPSTDYYWTLELYSIIEGVEVISSDSEYIGNVCGNYGFTTSAPLACVAPDDFEVVTFS